MKSVSLRSICMDNSINTYIIRIVIMVLLNTQNSTNPQRVEECNHTGWSDEPVDFKAYCAFDCDIQIWAYRFVDGTSWYFKFDSTALNCVLQFQFWGDRILVWRLHNTTGYATSRWRHSQALTQTGRRCCFDPFKTCWQNYQGPCGT